MAKDSIQASQSITDVTVIAGGWSVEAIDLEKLRGYVIAVNDAAIYAPRWDASISMDRLWTESRFEPLMARVQKDRGRTVWLRRSAVQNLSVQFLPHIHVFECDHQSNEFSEDFDTLNGMNSGACALNLAYLLKPQRVFLLGFDMNRSRKGRAYWYEPYAWTAPSGATKDGKYRAWASEFDKAAQSFRAIGCDVFNVSPTSAIKSFKKIDAAEYRRQCT